MMVVAQQHRVDQASFENSIDGPCSLRDAVPEPKKYHLPGGSNVGSVISLLSAAKARRRPAARTPLTQPCAAVAHGRSRAFAPRLWSPSWSPFSWRDLTCNGSRWRTSPRAASTKVLLLTRSDSV